MTTRIPVTVEGNLTGDPEHGASDSGNEYARFTVAVNDRRLNETTNRWEDAGTVFHRVVVFNEGLVRIVEQYLKKGSKIYLEGQLETRKWQDKDGNDKYSTEVVLRNFSSTLTMLDGRNDGAGAGAGGGGWDQDRAPARIHDALVVKTSFAGMKGPRLNFRQRVERDGMLLAEAEVVAVAIHPDGRARKPSSTELAHWAAHAAPR